MLERSHIKRCLDICLAIVYFRSYRDILRPKIKGIVTRHIIRDESRSFQTFVTLSHDELPTNHRRQFTLQYHPSIL